MHIVCRSCLPDLLGLLMTGADDKDAGGPGPTVQQMYNDVRIAGVVNGASAV